MVNRDWLASARECRVVTRPGWPGNASPVNQFSFFIMIMIIHGPRPRPRTTAAAAMCVESACARRNSNTLLYKKRFYQGLPDVFLGLRRRDSSATFSACPVGHRTAYTSYSPASSLDCYLMGF